MNAEDGAQISSTSSRRGDAAARTRAPHAASSARGWDGSKVRSELLEEEQEISHKQDELHAQHLALRARNHNRLLRQVRKVGPDGPVPKKLEVWSDYNAAREIKLQAELDLIRSVRAAAWGAPATLRKILKAARDTTAGAILYEDEVVIYVRARNKKIGRLLFWIDEMVGRENVALAEWGRGGEYVSPNVVARAIQKANRDRLVERIEPGSRPRDPEFSRDEMRRVFEMLRDRKAGAK